MFMTVDALGMKGIGRLHDLRAFYFIGLMAIIAGRRSGFPCRRLRVTGTARHRFAAILRVMVTIPAGNGIPGRTQVHLMVEKHPAGNGMVHYAQRSIGRLGRNRVANNSHCEQSDCQNVSRFQIFL
jgi:hypothetical protein